MFVSDQRAEFKNRFSSWSLNHPRAWSVQTDTTGLTGFLQDEIGRVVDAQLKTSARISENVVASQERIAEGIDRVNFGVERISDGLESLEAAFQWGFDELIWQVEEQRMVLQQILEVLQKPLDTQAKELKARADEAYRNGWFDDALSDFAESEKKNRYDFTIHQSLGNIYLFEKKDSEKALEYYEKAVRYARPKSAYHASLAFIHIALIKYFHGDFTGACQATSQAIALTPLLYEAHYQHAQYCANLGKYDEALDHIKKAVEGDRYYSVKVFSEKDFNVMKEQLVSFFIEMRNEKRSVANNKIDRIKGLVQEAESQEKELSSYLEQTKIAVNRALELLRRDNLLDSFDAISEADKASRSFSKALSEFTQSIERQIDEKASLKENKRRGQQARSGPEHDNTIFLDVFAYLALGISFLGLLAVGLLEVVWSLSVGSLLVPRLVMIAIMATAVIWLVAVKRALKARRRNFNELELKSIDDDMAALKARLASIHERFREYSRRQMD
jgi:tetratricopeptide (TPR) repeat protein